MNTNAPAQGELPLEEIPDDGRAFVNGSLWFVDADGCRVVFHRHEALYRMALGDVVHLRLVAVSLRQSGLATQEEIASAFGHSVITQARWERQYQKDGINGLMPQRRPGRGPDLDKTQENLVRTWFRQGFSNCYMAKRLCVDEATIRRTLQRLKLTRRPALLPELPGIEQQIPEVLPAGTEATTATSEHRDVATAETPPAVIPSVPSLESCGTEVRDRTESPAASSFTLDHDPRDRSGDRALARVGLLEDATPLFADHESLPRAGALLAVPLLVRHGLLEAFAKVYGSLQPSFYGLRTIVVTLFLGAVADQAARALERIPSGGFGSDPRVGSGAGSQDGAAQVHADGGDGTRETVDGRGGPPADRPGRGTRGVSLRRWARAGIPREISAV